MVILGFIIYGLIVGAFICPLRSTIRNFLFALPIAFVLPGIAFLIIGLEHPAELEKMGILDFPMIYYFLGVVAGYFVRFLVYFCYLYRKEDI